MPIRIFLAMEFAMAKTQTTPDRVRRSRKSRSPHPPSVCSRRWSTANRPCSGTQPTRSRSVVWEMDARLGGQWHFTSIEKNSAKEFEHHGEVLEVEPPGYCLHLVRELARGPVAPHSGALGTHAKLRKARMSRSRTAVWRSFRRQLRATARLAGTAAGPQEISREIV